MENEEKDKKSPAGIPTGLLCCMVDLHLVVHSDEHALEVELQIQVV